jgi:hypothetical protein
MCHLSVPWHPRDNPKNYPKLVFDGFLQNMVKRSENQAAQKCSISYCVICEKGGLQALRFIFFGINVPGCAILVFRGSPPLAVFKKISREPKTFLLFLL